MIKKTVCALLALVLILSLCACAKRDANDGKNSEPTAEATEKPAQETPDPDGENNVTVPADDDAGSAFNGVDDGAVLISFTGLKEAEVTAAQLKDMKMYEYTETTGDETPVFCGPLVRDVLAAIGASEASSMNIMLGGGQASRSFNISELDLDTAILAVIMDGSVQGEGVCTLVCTTHDGFSYLLNVNSPIVLE